MIRYLNLKDNLLSAKKEFKQLFGCSPEKFKKEFKKRFGRSPEIFVNLKDFVVVIPRK